MLNGIHILAKPAGPSCNLDCAYCFYSEKRSLFAEQKAFRMSEDVLRAYITKYIDSQPTPEVEFVWQGGEPTLLGIDFFKKIIDIELPFVEKKVIRNCLQTNGTFLDEKWCRFLKKYNFLVGISLDGPSEIHDRYRKDKQGRPTFDRVMRGLKLLQKYEIEYNIMACVAKETAYHPLRVYNFFKSEGVRFIQFFPVVERMPDERAKALGLRFALPASLDTEETTTQVTEWTVEAEKYGDFLISIFEEWVKNDVGKTFVMNFEWALNAYMGNPSPVCVFAKQCGRSVALEHNGNVYACDHCVYPAEYLAGNILQDNLSEMMERLLQFGTAKERSLPRFCRECDVLRACNGGCPKHRFATTCDGEPGLHYLCSGYRKYFRHICKYLNVMSQFLKNGLPASYVMNAVKGPFAVKLT